MLRSNFNELKIRKGEMETALSHWLKVGPEAMMDTVKALIGNEANSEISSQKIRTNQSRALADVNLIV